MKKKRVFFTSIHWLFCWHNQWLRITMNGLASFKPPIWNEGGGGPPHLLVVAQQQQQLLSTPMLLLAIVSRKEARALFFFDRSRDVCTWKGRRERRWPSLWALSSPLVNNLTLLKRIEWSLDEQIVTVGLLSVFFFLILFNPPFSYLTWLRREWPFFKWVLVDWWRHVMSIASELENMLKLLGFQGLIFMLLAAFIALQYQLIDIRIIWYSFNDHIENLPSPLDLFK